MNFPFNNDAVFGNFEIDIWWTIEIDILVLSFLNNLFQILFWNTRTVQKVFDIGVKTSRRLSGLTLSRANSPVTYQERWA